MRDTSSGFTKVSPVVRLGSGPTSARARTSRGTRSIRSSCSGSGISSGGCTAPAHSTSSRLCSGWSTYSRSSRSATALVTSEGGRSRAQPSTGAASERPMATDAVGRTARPVSFVASPRIGTHRAWPAPHAARAQPELRFKLDPTPGWDEDLWPAGAAGLRRRDRHQGSYRNVSVAMAPEAGLYRRVIEGLPAAWMRIRRRVRDVALLAEHRERITWDEPIHSIADVEAIAGDRGC